MLLFIVLWLGGELFLHNYIHIIPNYFAYTYFISHKYINFGGNYT